MKNQIDQGEVNYKHTYRHEILPSAEEVIRPSLAVVVPAKPADPEDNVKNASNASEQKNRVQKNATQDNRQVEQQAQDKLYDLTDCNIRYFLHFSVSFSTRVILDEHGGGGGVMMLLICLLACYSALNEAYLP